MKFTVAYNQVSGETHMVILLDREKGTFKRQHNTIEELKTDIGEDIIICYVADKYNNIIPDLHNLDRSNFNFDELAKIAFLIE